PSQQDATTACRRKLNGSAPHEAALRARHTRGVTNLRRHVQTTPLAGIKVLSPLEAASRTASGYTIFAKTSTSGVATGTQPATIRSRPNAIQPGLERGSDAPRAA